MKLKSVEVNVRVTIVKSNCPGRLGMTGYIVSSNRRDAEADLITDSTCVRIHLDNTDVVMEIPEQDGILVGKTNIPINERVKVLFSEDTTLIDTVGYITQPFSSLMTSDTHCIAGLWIEGDSVHGNKCNLTQGDVVIRYPQEVL